MTTTLTKPKLAALSGLAVFVLAFGEGSARGEAVIQTQDRLEINWSTLRIRFYGEAKLGREDADFKGAERQAWRDGLNYVTEAARDLHVAANERYVNDPERLTRDAKAVAESVATSTYSYNTTYFGDGTIRVHLENSLSKVLATSIFRFHQRQAQDTSMIHYTGVVFRTDRSTVPSGTYQVKDEKGAILFDVSDMAREAFEKNLMGRWFKRPDASELASAVGKNPLFVDAKVDGDALVVPRKTWDEAMAGHRALLRAGLIAIALP